MKHIISYQITAHLWRGDHAQPEEIRCTVRTDRAPWSEQWIMAVISRIWDMTNYSTIQIRTALESIHIDDVTIDYDPFAEDPA